MRTPIALCALLLLVSCGKKETSSALAKVGAVEITPADLQAEMERRVAARHPVGNAADLLEDMIREEVLVQQAEKAGLADDPELRRTYRQMLIGQLKERQLRADLAELSIDDSEIAAHYTANRERFAIPARIQLAMIQVKDDEPRAREVLTAVSAGADFAKLAARHSDHQASRYRGGDIGWVTAGAQHRHLPAEVLTAASHAEKATLITSGRSSYIVRRTDHQPGGHRELATVANSIRAELLRAARAKLTATFYANMEAGSEVVRLRAPDESTAPAPTTEPKFPTLSANTATR